MLHRLIIIFLPITWRLRNCWTGSRCLDVRCGDVGFGGFGGLKLGRSLRHETGQDCVVCRGIGLRIFSGLSGWWPAVVVVIVAKFSKFSFWSIFSLYRTIVSQSSRDTIDCSVTLPLLFSCCTGYLPAVHSLAAITSSPPWQRPPPVVILHNNTLQIKMINNELQQVIYHIFTARCYAVIRLHVCSLNAGLEHYIP